MDLQDPEIRSTPVSDPRSSKRLTPTAQVAILLLAVGCGVAIFIVASAVFRQVTGSSPARPSTETAATGDAQAFTVPDKQWAALKIQRVEERVFQNASETDGKIAIDDDLATPVFSPYSGRVTRLFARAGDSVKQGDPLFGIQATELAQAQNDLITAAAGLKTAKAQLSLAATNEKRQHDLYIAQGAALKDWQQAQVDLLTAQGGVNTASIAVAAVRNRLRAFGKSDQDIDQLAATADIAS